MTLRRRSKVEIAIVAAALVPVIGEAMAGARHVRESVPAAEAIIRGNHAEYVIRFDGPVDHRASRMELVQSGRVVRILTPSLDSEPDVLFASGEVPAAGHYVLHWQVSSPEDAAITSGDIPFSVGE